MQLRRALGVISLTVFGCGSALPSLMAQGATDLKCDQSQLTHQGIRPYYEKVSGCGKQIAYFYDRPSKKWISPVERAAFDLGCPREQVTATMLDQTTWGVSGCDKRGTYVLLHNDYTDEYKWVMNTAGQTAQPAQ